MVKYKGIEKLKDVPVCDFCIEIYKKNDEVFKTEQWVADKSWWKAREEVIYAYQTKEKQA
jgi:hypothetical protein